MHSFQFKLLHTGKKTRARVGEIHTPHGVIETPAFVPVGTQATVKSLTPEELESLGVQLFFVNTYHAYLRPGVEVIKKFGGLHKMMNWDKPLITDSGGFQIFSLGAKRFINIAISESAVLDRKKFTMKLSRKAATKENVFPDDYRPIGELVKIDEEGVTFTSHWDGSQHRFTPEISMGIQHALGSDIMIAFDECPPYPTTKEYALAAWKRTYRWGIRSLEFHRKYYSLSVVEGLPQKKGQSSTHFVRSDNNSYQALYGVVQGSVFKDLRIISAKTIGTMDFDGFAIGGVAVGESKKEMRNVCDWVMPYLPPDKPRHLLGVGEIDDIFDVIARGVDTFDCVQPTRLARMGHLFISNIKNQRSKTHMKNKKYTLDINKKEFNEDTNPVDSTCNCYTCIHFSRAYLHHLFRVRELLAYRLATIHNLHFVLDLVKQIRQHIKQGTFLQFKQAYFRIL